MLADRVDIGPTVARERRIFARDDADLHVLVHIERNGDKPGPLSSWLITPEHTV